MAEAKVIAICNQKERVGKTTTTLNLGVGLARSLVSAMKNTEFFDVKHVGADADGAEAMMQIGRAHV